MGLEIFDLKGGMYAVFTYKGAANAFGDTLYNIITGWLPASPYKLDNIRSHFFLMGEKYKGKRPFIGRGVLAAGIIKKALLLAGLSFIRSLLLFRFTTVKHPLHAKLIGAATIICAPEHISQVHAHAFRLQIVHQIVFLFLRSCIRLKALYKRYCRGSR